MYSPKYTDEDLETIEIFKGRVKKHTELVIWFLSLLIIGPLTSVAIIYSIIFYDSLEEKLLPFIALITIAFILSIALIIGFIRIIKLSKEVYTCPRCGCNVSQNKGMNWGNNCPHCGVRLRW